jgi:hypothetical protein
MSMYTIVRNDEEKETRNTRDYVSIDTMESITETYIYIIQVVLHRCTYEHERLP